MSDYYIGLMSGTSMDGIDAALVSFGESSLEILQTREHEYPPGLRQELAAAMLDSSIRTFDDVGGLHKEVGECFRDAANALLADAGTDATAVTAIGSHGQTVRHEPDVERPFSLQIGDPAIIAAGTGITTIADFRSADIALGGQGAPLAPAFHEWLFREAGTFRVVVNIGGIANITFLPASDDDSTGFDTGPGNTLLDAWTRTHTGERFDRNGAWAATGTVDENLLRRLLADQYFAAKPPKSTGFEHFNLSWLEEAGVSDDDPANVQATLCALTATSVADAVRTIATHGCNVFICGGGVHNAELIRQLAALLPECKIETTASAGLDPDWVEAAAFAWLAMRHTRGLPGNLPAVTGASAATLLGTAYPAD